MLEESDEAVENDGAAEVGPVPPPRRGSRDERRETTLRAFAAGQDAFCAFCGRQLPAIPARGGRPTPYCPPDPDRHGRWGAKVITCAMLDECREIWVGSYGADQPMTQVDVHTLDQRAAALLAVLDPVRGEIGALRARLAEEAAAALAGKAAAEQARAHAEAQSREAAATRAEALDQAERARQRAETDRAGLRAAQELSARSVEDKDEALAQQQAAQKEKDKALADRERALDQLTAAQERIAGLQNTLAAERAAALERLDRLRREEDQARQDLRSALTTDFDTRLRARTEEFDNQARSLRAAADQRAAELNSQLTQATHTYADTLGPLHEQLTRLRTELAEQTARATAHRHQLDSLRATLTNILDQTTEDQPMRQHVAALLGRPSDSQGPALPES